MNAVDLCPSYVLHAQGIVRRNAMHRANGNSKGAYYYRFSQPRDHLQWRLVLGYYDKVKLLSKGLLAKLA